MKDTVIEQKILSEEDAVRMKVLCLFGVQARVGRPRGRPASGRSRRSSIHVVLMVGPLYKVWVESISTGDTEGTQPTYQTASQDILTVASDRDRVLPSDARTRKRRRQHSKNGASIMKTGAKRTVVHNIRKGRKGSLAGRSCNETVTNPRAVLRGRLCDLT